MKVFISWSGAQSRQVAEALHWWLPKVLQGVRPFVSSKDIDKGANWTVALASELEDSSFGIVCLTTDNLQSPWLHYETGAISSSVGARVCPVLHGVTKDAVEAPLKQLQITELDQEDVLLMMSSMNRAAGEPLSAEDLKDQVDIWWPKLDERIAGIPATPAPPTGKEDAEPEQPVITEKEILQQVLDIVRRLDDRIDRPVRPRTQQAAREHRVPRAALRYLQKAMLEEDIATSEPQVVGDTVVIDARENLPDPLPPGLREALDAVSRHEQVTVLLTGRDRTIDFKPSRGGSDLPVN